MYTLLVFHADSATASEIYKAHSAGDVLMRIPELLEAHSGCERVVVMLDHVRLFSVDCAGNRLP
jgi:hypothetical protein